MLYSIGSRYDYDQWASIVRDKSWNWEGVLPYFKKSQRMADPAIKRFDRNAFGTKGPITITKDRIPTTQKFIKAFKELGFKAPLDFNGNRSLGYAPQLFFIGDGVRQSSAESYISKTRLDNFNVLRNSIVTKVIVNRNKIATGIQVLTQNKRLIVLNARKEIIITAGAILQNSPKILLQSGIGPEKDLKNKNIPVIVDLPVGKNLIDHIGVVIIYDLIKMTYDPLPRNPHVYPDPTFTGFAALDRNKEVPDYETLNFIDPIPNLMYYCVVAYNYVYEICNNLFKKPYTNLMLWTLLVNLQPKSRGEVTIRSNDVNDPPIVNPSYYSEKTDLKDHVNQIKGFIKVENTTLFKELEAKFKDPRLQKCKGLEFGSQKYWECYTLCMMSTQWHFSGTCSMGSVVDSRLRVRGIRKLRVADASVIPISLSGNIKAAVFMLAEKTAAILKEDYFK